MTIWFESFVNSERYKTTIVLTEEVVKFESFVNSERYKTGIRAVRPLAKFESFVNSERYKTVICVDNWLRRLRALLIQKDTKQYLLSKKCFTV